MSSLPYATCEHVMASGLRCGSPALNGNTHCYYHTSMNQLLPRRFHVDESFRNVYDHGVRLFPLPLLEDATSVQTALMQGIHALLEGSLPPRTAQVLTGMLRLAQKNMVWVKAERKATEQIAAEAGLQPSSDASRECAWANTAEDKLPRQELMTTTSPAHLVGNLGEQQPVLTPLPQQSTATAVTPAAASPTSSDMPEAPPRKKPAAGTKVEDADVVTSARETKRVSS